jgi:dynein heavy chain, axonemal
MLDLSFHIFLFFSFSPSLITPTHPYTHTHTHIQVLANKMTKLYGLAESQLSKQYHYDFSLRTLKSVLVTAGDLKRKYSHMSEDLVLMRALRDQNLPRFVFDDVPLFLDLLQDLFPGLDCPRVGFPELKASVAEYFEEKFMHHSDEAVFETQVNKSIQIYETLGTRHTIIVVGPTGGGKTTVTEALASGMKVDPINRNVKIHVINPKAQNVSELYGNLNQATREWTDGILSNKFRSINEPLPASRSNEMRWLIFDGDVDAVWIEDMNSVMDDNKTLTLPNSERIQLQDYTKLFVEVFDLQYASPATISRCGVVYVDPKDIGYRPFFERWIKTRPDCCEEDQAFLMTLLEKYIVPVADFIFDGVSLDGTIGKRLPRVMEITSMSSIRQFCSMFDSVTKKKSDDTMKKEKDKGPQKSDRKFLEANFMYCTFWAYGSLLSSNDQLKLDEIIGELTTLQMPHGSLFDYFYDDNTKAWVKWEDVVPKYEQPNPFRFAKVLVPTTSSVIYTRILDLCYEANKPALFVGESGTAKTVTIQNFLNTLDKKSNIQLGINFSSRTNGNDVYVNLNNCVDKRTSNIYGPQSGMTLNMFVDDMSMPKIDLYGTQQPAAFLLLLLSRGCYYSKEKDLDLRLIRDVKYFGAMAPPGGGRNSIDPRFAACFNVFNLNTPSETVLRSIYSSIITTFVNSGTFSGPVKKAAEKITNISLRLFFHLLEKLPPTPAKFHYIFNLRDLGRVFEGLCRMTPDKFTTKKHIVRLFVNECSRVFSDRLISEQDQTIFFSKLSDLVKSDFSSISNDVLKKPLLYGSFGNCIARLEDGVEDLCLYDDMGDHDSVAKIFENVLELYNIENELKQMNLVLFSSAVEHLVRLHRVLTTPLGNALLVGVGGSGKQSVTHLASFCAGYHVFTITLSRGYGENEFREELKELFRIAYKKPVTFLFTDAHCVEEGFLELINNILTVGMVPALFRDEDKDAVVRLVTPAVKEAGLMPTELNCMNHFKNVCRNNIHVVLAMTPSGTTLFNRCRAFPGLVSASVIDWFFPWPKEALLKVVSHFMEDLSLKEEYRHPIAEHFVMVHSDVVRRAKQYEEEERRFYCVTPKNYLDFISNYKTITAKTLESVEKSVARLGGGLEKLAEAEKSIAKMQIELEKAQKIVSDKAQECEVMIADITEKSEKTEKSQKAARVMEKDLEEKSKVIESEKSKADKALEEAIPALEAAAEALENLDKADITEIRGFANPPEAVKKVSLCVLHLKPLPGKFTEDWKGCKTMLSNMKFLDSLKEYNKDHMKDSQVRKVQKYMKDPEFTPEAVAVKSKAGGGLLTWVYALVKYHGVAKNVAPLRAKVKQMTKEKEESEEQLDKIQTKLSELQAEIDELSQKYESKSSELTKLKNELDEMNNRLTTAKNLIAGLSSEQKRWTKQKEDLVEKRNHIPGDCLLAASFLSYLGAFTLQYREMMMEDWMLDIVENRNVPLTKDYSLRNILTTDAEIQQWIGEGLPGDKHSIQNGILTSTALRFPLCIDPQQQAVKWIKNKEGDALVVRTFNSSDFVRRLQLAVQYVFLFYSRTKILFFFHFCL